MRGQLERRSFLTMVGGLAASTLLTGCPPQLVSSGPKKGVKRVEKIFWNDKMNRGVKAVVLYPQSEGRADLDWGSAPIQILVPGFIDTSFGLEYLGRELVQELGFYVIIPDPDDALNLLPQGGGWIEAHFPQMAQNLLALQEQLEAVGYPLDADNVVEILDWVYSSLDGDVTDQTALTVVQGFFDYRLTDVEAIIMDCLNKKADLPAKELINHDCVFVGGHSLGGFTSLELAGAGNRSSLPAGLVKAALVMAPATGFFTPTDLGMIKVPTLWMRAGHDKPNINDPLDKIYEFCPSPTHLIDYEDFEHADFSDTFRWLYNTGADGLAKQKIVRRAATRFYRGEYRKFLRREA